MKVIYIFTLMSFYFGLQSQDCRKFPDFALALGFDVTRSAFSSSEHREMGLLLVELDPKNLRHSARSKTYKDPTWDDAGYLGPITIDRFGNGYVSAKPNVNMLYNPIINQNTIYKIDNASGKMSSWLVLPYSDESNNQNPYGIVGMYYDCNMDYLIVSTVSGSTQSSEVGKIFRVDVRNKTYELICDGVDAMGVITLRRDNKNVLIYGSARTSDVYSVELDSKYQKVGNPKKILTLEGLGSRGDDRARKIRVDGDNLLIDGTTFYYNLTAPTFIQESKYTFDIANNFALLNIR